MNRTRLLERLDHMVESGQVTAEEAGRLRSATTDAEFEAAALAIRTRHASASMSAAVEAGQMTRAEADANLAGVRNGEHPRGLRAHMARITRPAG